MTDLLMTDFDGTLFPKENSTLSPEFVHKIIALTNKGCLFAVNSGRPYSSLKRLLTPLENRTFYVCNDGAQIMYKNCLIYKAALPQKQVRAVCTAALQAGFTVMCCLREQTVNVDPAMLENGPFYEDVFKIIIIKNKAEHSTANVVKLGVSLGMKVCYEDETYTELNRADVDKGTAGDFLKTKYGVNGKVFAFGDSRFDLPMYQKADRCYVVESGEKLALKDAVLIKNTQQYIIENF